MRKIWIPFLCVSIVACTQKSTPEAETAVVTPTLETIVLRDHGTCALCGSWSATKVTINGVSDPDMDPTGKVDWIIRPDSTLTMLDAMEGSLETMDGKWRADEKGRLTLIDPEGNEFTEFLVTRLNNSDLVMQVLEEDEAEVLLYFSRQ